MQNKDTISTVGLVRHGKFLVIHLLVVLQEWRRERRAFPVEGTS